MSRTKVAVIGSGNIGTDLMIKVLRLSESLHVAALVGIDPASDGLARASRLGVTAVSNGVEGLMALPDFDEIGIVFDATSAGAHVRTDAQLQGTHVSVIDLTPAAIGPYVVPAVNLDEHLSTRNVNMVTCGGQATIPIVAAIASVTQVHYAEIVASIASKSAGPGTRANIDEFTQTTARGLEVVGGAARGKAIIVLNPAEPPLLMRDTVLAIVDDVERVAVADAVEQMVAKVASYVPGYRLKHQVQIRRIAAEGPERILAPDLTSAERSVVTVFLEVEGAGHYLPPYAGNLDIMTSAALQVAERIAMGSLDLTDVTR
jgi:acetaldehyde dehydrogenase